MGGDLWCQERYCSVNNLPLVFDHGEQLGDLHIIQMVVVLHTATIYAAERNGEKVLLKVAHDGYHARLIREANFLRHLQQQDIAHPLLPTLLQAHTDAPIESFPVGTTVFGERTLTYLIFDYQEGDILRNALLKNRQPWYQHAGWIVMALLDGVALLHQQGVYHLCLSPEAILLRNDQEKIPRPLLLDLGALTDADMAAQAWQPTYLPAAYTAPELIENRRLASGKTDTYGIGLIFYEMLAGQPAYAYRLKWAVDILDMIQTGTVPPLERPDLNDDLIDLVNRTTKHKPEQRPEIHQFGHDMLDLFPPLPPEKKPWRFNWNLLWIVLGVLFILSLLLVTAYVLAEPLTSLTELGDFSSLPESKA